MVLILLRSLTHETRLRLLIRSASRYRDIRFRQRPETHPNAIKVFPVRGCAADASSSLELFASGILLGFNHGLITVWDEC